MNTVKRNRSPSIEKTEATKNSILKAALKKFLEVGFANTKIRDIADLAQVGVGTVYCYFKTKEDLFEGVINIMLNEEFMVVKADTLKPDQSVYEFLYKHFEQIIEFIYSSGRDGISKLVIKEGQNFPQLKEIYFNKMVTPYLREFEKLATIAHERKEISLTCTPAEFALLIVAPIWMGILYNGILQERESISINHIFYSNLYALFHSKVS
ncbi:TetR/AcrR family transcriptional regulator [Acinetobacter baumannii]|uniref:TetR/AcrR family transcriptional regulator n=1 Tax=Acinetobacter baumannii TaxID=470 RepID=UPI003A885444